MLPPALAPEDSLLSFNELDSLLADPNFNIIDAMAYTGREGVGGALNLQLLSDVDLFSDTTNDLFPGDLGFLSDQTLAL